MVIVSPRWHPAILLFLSLMGVAVSFVPAKFQNSQHSSHRLKEQYQEHEDVEETIENMVEHRNHTHLQKRGDIRIYYRTADEQAELQQGYQDFLTLVNYINSNFDSINPAIFNVYFAPSQRAKVKQIAPTIIAMSQPGGITNMGRSLRQFRPTDLSEILLLRDHGSPLVLAQALNVQPRALDPSIYIYDFGWQVLYKRLLSEYTCDMIGPKVNYKMQFLGGLILHEVLHFYNVGQLAWNEVLIGGGFIDDQPGHYCGLGKAYGPYEARMLRSNDPGLALINNENYVWFFLVGLAIAILAVERVNR